MTIDQLRRWFTPSEYQTLVRLGFYAVKMEVGRVIASSDVQCFFERVTPLWQDFEKVELYPEVKHVWEY
jgi:hypothetical protein